MTTSDATIDPGSFPPEAEAIHQAIRAIVDARATGSQAMWAGMGLLEAAYGDKAFRYEKSVFRDNDGAHGRTPPTLPRPDLDQGRTGKRIVRPRTLRFDASALTNDQVTILRSARVDPATGTVVADTGNPVDPQIDGAVRAIRELVRKQALFATVTMATDHNDSPFPGPRGADLEWAKAFMAVYRVVSLLAAGDAAGAEESVLRCAAEADNPSLAANCALATAGFLYGVMGVGWAALGVAAGNAVVACGCWDCDPPEHYTPRR